MADGNMSSMTLHPTNTPPEIPKISRKLRGTHSPILLELYYSSSDRFRILGFFLYIYSNYCPISTSFLHFIFMFQISGDNSGDPSESSEF